MAAHDRGYLRYQRGRIIRNRLKWYREDRGWRDWRPHRIEQPGRLAKTDPWDCGRSCYMCHWDKLYYGGGKRRRRGARLASGLGVLKYLAHD